MFNKNPLLFFSLIFLLVSTFTSFKSHCQSAEVLEDKVKDFQKYSYLILRYPKIESTEDREKCSVATGFFIRHKKKLFLVSNYHVLTGAGGYSSLIMENFDSPHLAQVCRVSQCAEGYLCLKQGNSCN
jgi:hypothetical protein